MSKISEIINCKKHKAVCNCAKEQLDDKNKKLVSKWIRLIEKIEEDTEKADRRIILARMFESFGNADVDISRFFGDLEDEYKKTENSELSDETDKLNGFKSQISQALCSNRKDFEKSLTKKFDYLEDKYKMSDALKEIQSEHEKTLDYNKPGYKYKKPVVISRTHCACNKDMVHHPEHYNTEDTVYEPYLVIAAWKKNFNVGSAIKYLARYEKKFNPIEDLEKAKQYIDFEIEELKKKDVLGVNYEKDN